MSLRAASVRQSIVDSPLHVTEQKKPNSLLQPNNTTSDRSSVCFPYTQRITSAHRLPSPPKNVRTTLSQATSGHTFGTVCLGTFMVIQASDQFGIAIILRALEIDSSVTIQCRTPLLRHLQGYWYNQANLYYQMVASHDLIRILADSQRSGTGIVTNTT